MNRNPPLVSVLIPTYNYGAYIARAIDSVLAQTVSDYEIIVVDDGSTDDTAQILSAYPGVRYIRQENLGVGAARETARLAARGRYIAFIDADDLWHPQKLEKQLAYMEAHPQCRIVFACAENFYECPALANDPDAKRVHDEVYRYYMGTCLMEASLLGEVGGFDVSLRKAEDSHLVLKLAGNGIDITHYIDEPLYSRRLHGKNITLTTEALSREMRGWLIARAMREMIRRKNSPVSTNETEVLK